MYHIDRINESNVCLLSIVSGLAFIFVSVKLWDYEFYLISLPTLFVGIIAILISANNYPISIREKGDSPQTPGVSLGSESSKIMWLRLTEKTVGWFLVVASGTLSIFGFMLFDKVPEATTRNHPTVFSVNLNHIIFDDSLPKLTPGV
jgi:hypothetical protein